MEFVTLQGASVDAKIGALCCVAARPHGSRATSREWSVGCNEPFWPTSSSFSPPLSTRWDYRFRAEGFSFGSQGDDRVVHCGSSISLNDKSSRSWERNESFANHQFSVSDGALSCTSSPSDSFQNYHLRPPVTQGASIEEYIRDPVSGPLVIPRFVEGKLGLPSFNGSFSSRSDGSEYDAISKSHGSAGCSFSSHRFFMPKAIHPLSVPDHIAGGEERNSNVFSTISGNSLHTDHRFIRPLAELHSFGLSETSGVLQKEPVHWDNSGNVDFMDICELLEPKSSPHNSLHELSKCGLCERWLSQRSPWSSRRIVCSGDLPTASVLSCWHVYHSECLERTTPKISKHDPPCPLCSKLHENISDNWAGCRMKNGFRRLKSPGEGPSRIWSCAQAGDCVEGALHAPKHGGMVLLSKSHIKRQLSMKGNLTKKQSEDPKRNGIQVVSRGRISEAQGAVGCSSSSLS
ncbi:uncharacterized protein LOC122013585 [Zingiber officinale]|uniref:uncharacterized protein LOC122013585 n=1 Tax=Zingiber officinale TaxID=94328 RepID=UPI001C4D41C6|nr:uncharacterized protein LOC122013585 [Zingiber officinale]